MKADKKAWAEKMLAMYNPFSMYNPATKQLMLFSSGTDGYYHLLSVLYQEFTKGFIDVTLLLMDYFGYSVYSVRKFTKGRDYVFIDFFSEDKVKRNQQIKDLLFKLKEVNEIPWNEQEFKDAISRFDNMIEMAKVNYPEYKAQTKVINII